MAEESAAKKARTEIYKTSHHIHAELEAKLAEVRAKRAFDPAAWVDQITDKFNDYLRANGLKAASISVSGGVDSGVTFGLMVLASKKPNSPLEKVLGVAQPIKSTESVWKRALECETAFGAKVVIVDQTPLHDQLISLVDTAVGITGKPFSTGQLRSYQRTPVNYYVAQLLSQEGLPCVVVGTGNYDEDGYLRYFCKAGDGVVDVQLISDLHKSEVFTVGAHIGVPASILSAPPTADLWDGQTDEDELGMSYDFIELYTEYLKLSEADRAAFLSGLGDEAKAQFEKLGTEADRVHRRNAHKANFPVNL